MTRASLWLVLAATLANCSDPEPPAADVASNDPGERAARAEPPAVSAAPVRDPRLIEDCGGWEPPAALLDVAAALADPARKAATLAQLDAMSAAERIDILRAGLRLRDLATAKACAGRLVWKQIDRWECARCVAVLGPEVLLADTEGQFDELRSYLGTVELKWFLERLPPQPWEYPETMAIGQLHRILHEDSLDDWMTMVRHPDPELARVAAREWWFTMTARCDRRREETVRLMDPALPGASPAPDSGLSPVLAAMLRRDYFGPPPPPEPGEKEKPRSYVHPWTRRWCLDSTPGPQDEALLVDLVRAYGTTADTIGGVAVAMLGRSRGAMSEVVLRAAAEKSATDFAWTALALRGFPGAAERLVAWTADARAADTERALAALMEADPALARRTLEARLLGADDRVAFATLDQLWQFLPPGSESDSHGFRFRTMSWDGLESEALRTPMSARRRALLGAAIPACRTRRMAEAACAVVGPEFFESEWPGEPDRRDALAFMETGAREQLRVRLTALAVTAEGDAREEVVDSLRLVSQPELWSAESFDPNSPVERAIASGAPPDIAGTLAGDDSKLPPHAVEHLAAGRWRVALHAILDAAPLEHHGDVGAVRGDERVRAYLQGLRARRDLELYWYATAQLAAWGDAAALAEFWGAMRDGRYRIIDELECFEKTLGRDFDATMPFWMEQLRSSCCRAVCGGGNPWDRYFDINGDMPRVRTPYDRVKELWEAAGGAKGFAWSGVLERYVIAPR